MRSKIAFFALTLIFYGWRQGWWLIPFFITVLFDFFWANLLVKIEKSFFRKLIVTSSIIQSIFLLALFKYKNLFSVTAWLPNITQDGQALALPAGISFYTFESMSFVIDIYRKKILTDKRKVSAADFFGFIGMFPRFIAGPIARYDDITSQFRNYQGMKVSQGIMTFIYGLGLKAIFADQLAYFVPYSFRMTPSSMPESWFGLVAYSLQIYFDFAGYSLMAIGLGQMLGFQFPQNFNRPYLARSLTEFWRRWHITLSSWLRDYLYISLGGNRSGIIRTLMNILITMALGGLWHGANITFLCWGIWHGVFLCLERSLCHYSKGVKEIGQFSTLLLVILGWVFFKSDNMDQVVKIFRSLFSVANFSFDFTLISARPLSALLAISALIFCFYAQKYENDFLMAEKSGDLLRQVAALGIFIFSISLLMGAQSIPFMYFQF